MPPAVVSRDQLHSGYIDLNQHELRNAIIQNLGADPGSPIDGQIWYRTDTDRYRIRANGVTDSLATLTDVGGAGIPGTIFAAKGDILTATANDTPAILTVGANGTVLVANSAQATGQEWRTLTEADIQLSATDRLVGRDTAAGGPAEELTVSGGLEFTGAGGIQRSALTGDVTASAGSNTTAIAAGVIVDADVNASAAIAATKLAFTPAQGIAATNVQAAIEEAVTDLTTLISNTIQGFAWKVPVRAATSAAGTLASSFENGDTIDGVVLATGDRILIKDQAAGAENGIYTVNASGAPTRATDMDIASEANNASVLVEEGTANKGNVYTQTANIITIGTTAMVWVKATSGNVTYVADGTTITLTGSTFSVTTAGITATQLAASVAGNGLTGGAGTALAVGAGTGIVVAADTVSVDRATALGRVALASSGSLTGGSVSEVITHHDCGKKLVLSVVNNASPFDEIDVYSERTSATTTTIYTAAGNTLPAGYVWTVVG